MLLVLLSKDQSLSGFFVYRRLTNLSPSLMYFLPLGLLGGYFAWRFYTTGSA